MHTRAMCVSRLSELTELEISLLCKPETAEQRLRRLHLSNSILLHANARRQKFARNHKGNSMGLSRLKVMLGNVETDFS